MLQSGAFLYRTLSVASDAPVCGTGFTPRRSSPGASAVLHSAPDAPIRGVPLSYSLRCLGRSSLWHRVHPQTIQSGGLCRASFRPGCSNPGCLCVVFSPLPQTLQSVAPGSPPDDPVRGLGPRSTPPRMLQSGVSCIFLSLLSSVFGCLVAGRGLVPCWAHTRPSGRRLLRCGDCGAWTCSWRLVRRRVWVFAVVVSCFVPWCVLACGASCVPCLACVWRALLARACCRAGTGTLPLSGGPVWLHGGPCWRPAVARRAAVGCVFVGGGGVVPLPSPSAPCPSVPFRRPALPAYPLRTHWVGLGWTVGLGGLTWSCGAPCRVYGVLGLLAPVHRRACPVCGVACAVSWAAWLLFTGVRAPRVVLRVRCPGPPGSCSPVCTPCVWCCVYGVLGLLAPVHRCARSVCAVVCTVSWVAWLLFTGVRALCVVLCVQCPGPPGSCSPVARSVCGVVCTVSWASLLLFTGVHALCVVLRVRCPGPPCSCSPVCTLCVWCCVYGVLGLLTPVHRRARSVCAVASTVSWASWLLFTGVHALCVVLWVRCLGSLGSCSPASTLCVRWCVRGVLGRLAPVHRCACLGVLCPVYGVLGPLAPVHRCARSVCGVVCVVSWAFWPLFAGVLVWCVLCCVCGVLGHLVRVLRCCGVLRCVWCSVCGVACAVSWASWPLFTGAHARCVVLCGRCPGPLGSCSPVCLCVVLCGVFGVLGLLAPSHRCACVVCCVVCAVSRATWLPFTGVVVWRARCPRPVHGVLCACSVCCVVCTVSPATWLLFTGVLARCVAWCVWCGCGCVLACAIPSSLHFSSRPRVGAVGLFMAQTPWGTPQRTRHWHSGQQGVRHPTESYLFFPSWTLCFWRRPRVSVS